MEGLKPLKDRMRYTAVLFDLDGTLLDTLDDLSDSVNCALKKQGLPIRTREEVCSFIGNGIVKLMERAVGNAAGVLNMERALRDFKEYYVENCQHHTRPYVGCIELLQELKSRGVKLGVVSNKADFLTQKLCKAYFGGLLDIVIGENEGAGMRRKPEPDALLAAMNALGVKAEEAVYVGDSDVDIQTARNVGMDCVSVAWGMKSRAFLEKCGASVIVEDVAALREWLLND